MKTAVHAVILRYVLHASVSSICYTVYSDACKVYHTITIHITVFLKMNPRVRNAKTTSNLKI